MPKINKPIKLKFVYGDGSFSNDGCIQIEDIGIENFQKWLKNEAIFCMNYDMIIRNWNYLSYIYLFTSEFPSGDISLNHEQEEYISNNYPDVIQELEKYGQAIVSYALIHQTSYLNDEFDCVEILESRIRNLGLASYLLKNYEKRSGRHVLPICLCPETSVTFWRRYFIYTDFEDEFIFQNDEAKKYLSPLIKNDNKLGYEILKIKSYRSLVNEIIKEYVYKKIDNKEIQEVYSYIFDKFISICFHKYEGCIFCDTDDYEYDKEIIIEDLKPLIKDLEVNTIDNTDKLWNFCIKKYSLNEVEKVQFK